MGFSVLALIIVLAAIAGMLFTLNGELAGLGRANRRGGLRAPHGALVRTKRLDAIEQSPFAYRFGIVLAIVVGVSVLLGLIFFTGIFGIGADVLLVVHFILVVALCVAVSQADEGIWRPLGWAMLGYLILAAIPCALWAYELSFISALSFSEVNVLTAVFGGLGCALAVALMPPVLTYAREFEDGHVNVIQISGRSIARRAFDALEDASWKPPANRIADFEAARDAHSFMGKR